MNRVRVRYAPSPTGHMHVGSLRTALYNWLFARHNAGTFLVRIEDTDIERSEEKYTESIIKTLAWTSLEPDEPLLIQSERKQIHQQVVDELVKQGKAYRCYCTQLGTEQDYKQYEGTCRSRQPQEGPSVVRFKIPQDRQVVQWHDLIRGPISFETKQLDDFIILRSDGMPTYNLVVVIDDAAQQISHVIRGEDHISNTPKQILLYEACGYTLPAFAHLSLILGPDGHRLSKRHGAVAVEAFKQEGFLADALCNYLVRLGWSHGDQEIFKRDELIEYFTLERMNKSGAIFDREKLLWVNGVFLRQFDASELLMLIERDVEPGITHAFPDWSMKTLQELITLYKERVKTLKELCEELRALYIWPQAFDSESITLPPETIEYLTTVHDALLQLEDDTPEAMHELLKKLDVPMKVIAPPLRLALTGQTSSPGVAQLLGALGGKESMHRIEYFMKQGSKKH